MPPRYAVYVAPAPEAALEKAAAAWLGRNARSGAEVARPKVPGIDAARLDALTAAPRRYGFHGTLTSPFRLAAGCGEQALEEAVAAFAASRRAFPLPPLRPGVLLGFLALLPAGRTEEIDALAADCVRAFHPLRAPISEEERARRSPDRLTPRQRAYLDRWGYPYVFEEFRFHMTLTDRVEGDERARLLAAIETLFAPSLAEPLACDAITLFREPAPGAPFRALARYPFGGAAPERFLVSPRLVR